MGADIVDLSARSNMPCSGAMEYIEMFDSQLTALEMRDIQRCAVSLYCALMWLFYIASVYVLTILYVYVCIVIYVFIAKLIYILHTMIYYYRQPTETARYCYFYLIWSLKEAFIKAIGQGLGFDLTQVSKNHCI